MYENVTCVSLRIVRHSDKASILTVWSAEHGRLSFAVSEGAGREARRRRALTMPLSVFDCVCDFRPGREIQSARDFRAHFAGCDLYEHPAKGAVAVFLADVLDSLLRQSAPDALLSDYLFESVAAFGAMERTADVCNFHLVFLYRLMHFVGIEPDLGAWSPGAVFDMRDGCFRRSVPLHGSVLVGAEVDALRALARLDFGNMHTATFTRAERNAVLDRILEYYSLHLTPLDSLRSVSVLRQLF